jgi:hypothetical protein
MKVLEGYGPNRSKVVISLCDYSGNWPRPYHEAGHTVLLYDLKHGDDLTKIDWISTPPGSDVVCIFAAPLCTTFTSTAALHWAKHKANGVEAKCVALADACMDIIEYFNPPTWALENPRGRIEQLIPRLAGKKRFEFNPCDYAGWLWPHALAVTADDSAEDIMASNRYTKRTGIWGECVEPERRPLPPIVFTTTTGKRGSVVWKKLGGKSERTKELRSRTPMGFARAFQSANGCG